jgi:predicted hydrolase (HD superfamily)
MTRSEAYTILTKYLHNKNLLKHCLAAEATMKALYKRLTPEGEQNSVDEEKWGIVGLMHDADYELAQQTNQLEKHGLLLFEKEQGTIPDDIAHAIKSHNYLNTKIMPENNMDWAIETCDQLTGLIVAAALIHPDKKLSAISPEFVLKRFGEKSFAKGASREAITLCEEKLHIPLEEFVTITLKAMQEISDELGL